MTPQIQAWMQNVARAIIKESGNVLEIGAMDVNGSIRSSFQDAISYIGTDMQAGDGVDLVLDNSKLARYFSAKVAKQFDTIIACEVLEHDIDFMNTVKSLHKLLISSGYLVISTPTFMFPEHRYPRDYWRFGMDAYQEVFFKNMDILDLRYLDSGTGSNNTIVGLAQKRVNVK